MNEFLLSRADIDNATKHFQENGLVESGISAKNWETFMILPYLGDGNLLDMGSGGGIVLENAVKKGLNGLKVGIDLAYAEDVSEKNGISLIKGDLMNVPFPDGFFHYITS